MPSNASFDRLDVQKLTFRPRHKTETRCAERPFRSHLTVVPRAINCALGV